MTESVPIILASQSPRRRTLLEQAGYKFQIIPPDEQVECGACSQQAPAELVADLATKKAHHVAQQVPRGLVIGCDTVAECQGQILGKPADEEHARRMLQLLSGREHRVFSGLCLWKKPEDQYCVDIAVTDLKMDQISDDEIERYLDTGEWEGKAGAFGYQDGLPWLRIIRGSQSNVVGLPLELLDRLLRDRAWTRSDNV